MNPRQLKEHLIRAGHLTESGLTRAARIRPCPDCHADTLAGLDEDRCALESAVDPVPLGTLGEAVALLQGRNTLAVHRDGGRFILDRRHPLQIKARPAGATDREDVMAEHRCGAPVPDQLAAATSFAETTPPLPAGSRPPF
jgi:hypothetical protein